MPDSETFDAFYARTAWTVTNQMHELAGDDNLADHAIREAYAKAYQQWYQVSGYLDSEGWVLATAKDAYERRRAEAASPGHSSAAEASDSGTWPGFFRPAAQPGRNGGPQDQPFADPDGTLAPPRHGGAARAGTTASAPGAAAPNGYPAAGDALAGNGSPSGAASMGGPADDSPGWYGPGGVTAPPTREIGFGGADPYGPNHYGPDPYRPDPYGPSRGGLGPGALSPHRRGHDGLAGRRGLSGPGRKAPGSGGPSHLATPRNLIVAGVAVAALVIVGITYVAGRGHNAPAPAASQGTGAKAAVKSKPRMLAAGRTGPRSAIPWTLVSPGWTLAEYSAAQPPAGGLATGSGRYTTYLVDPLGGKYAIATWSGSAAPQLVAWSGDGKKALFGPAPNSAATATGGAAGGYRILHVSTGHFTNLPLPSGVSPVGFTRPDGLNILAVQQKGGKFELERYSLAGAVTGKVGALASKHESWPADGCGYGCALSSPDGYLDVVGIFGDQMQLFSNGGGRGRKLKVPNSKSCVPLSWWDGSTILADCLVAGVPDDATRLWLVPENGGTPTPLTQAAAAGTGRVSGAWRAGSAVYVTSVNTRQCTSAPSAPGGLDIERLDQGTGTALTIPDSTSSTIVGIAGNRLLVLAQASCQGASSLVLFDPSAGTTWPVLPAPASQAGVIAAVPFGNGPTALSSGL
ncbi:MAG TPA: hypothetical protein VGH53_03020 [Streptosporangiaceae bacterium]